MNGDLLAAQSRRDNARYDARAAEGDAFAEAYLPGVLSETIERPPAVLDDDPAPARPSRPLESWAADPPGLTGSRAALGLTA